MQNQTKLTKRFAVILQTTDRKFGLQVLVQCEGYIY